MIKTTPFHPRLSALNETQLYTHWSGHLAAQKYQISAKWEYFALRNTAGLIDTSPLYKYRIAGPDAERFLSGVLARDVRACRDGQAQYTVWCDDRGFVVEDGVIMRHSADEFLLSSAEPNMAYFQNLIGHDRVEISDVSAELATLAVQGPTSRAVLAQLDPRLADLAYFHHAPSKLGSSAVTVSRTGYTGDLGYEIWTQADDALDVFDAVIEAAEGRGVIPCGNEAMLMARIEAGLVLIDVDFHSSRFAMTDHEVVSPVELGFRWMFRDLARDDRKFIGRAAIERELRDGASRWKQVGLLVDWRHWDQLYSAAGLAPPKDETPITYEMMLYDDDGGRVGFTTSFMYSPMLQRHIAMARVRPHAGSLGSNVNLELTINHQYNTVRATVARTPLFNPARKTA
jgi:aminomethyltransferase